MKPTPFDANSFSPEPGITLIEASAGTGKTYSITQIICGLIAKGQSRIDEILVLTFTETATQELRERIRAAISDELDKAIGRDDERSITLLSTALDNFESAAIFTIHGFCNRLLREFSVEAGIGSEFAILKNTLLFQEELETEVARQIQAEAQNNPFITLALNALELKQSFIACALNLREASDLLESSRNLLPPLQTWFKNTFDQLCAAWKLNHEQLRAELLCDNPPINRSRNVYKAAGLELLLDRLQASFECGSSSVYLDFLKDLQVLSRRELTDPKVLKKNRTLSLLQFYDQCDQAMEELHVFSKLLTLRILQIRAQRIETLVYQEQTLRFDDLLTFARKIVSHPSGHFSASLYKRYKVALIDEFQDTDPVQFSILDHIFLTPPEKESPRPLVLIGDPKQAIYGFRGGDIFTYNAAKERAKKIYFLDTNWRSSPAVNEGVNELLSTTAPFRFHWIDYQPVKTAPKNMEQCLLQPTEGNNWQCSSGIEWIQLEAETSDHQKIETVANDISELLQSRALLQTSDGKRALGPADIVVLVPDNRNGARIHEELGKKGVTSSIFGGASVFQSAEALQWYATLYAMLHPRDFSAVKGAVASSFFDPSLAGKIPESGDTHWTALLQDISTAGELWQSRGLSFAIAKLSRTYRWKEHLAAQVDANRALANHQQVLDLLLDQETSDLLEPTTLLEWFREHLEDPDSKDQEQLLQLDSDAAAVTIMTMHKSKGLEFPIVYIPFFPKQEGHPPKYPLQYHDLQTGELRTTFSKQYEDANASISRCEETRSESLRTLYVAITRTAVCCKLYLQPEKHEKHVLDAWLPPAAALSDRIDQLQHKGTSQSLPNASASTLLQDLRDKDEETPLLRPPQLAPLIPPAKTNLSFTGIVTGAGDSQTNELDEPLLFDYQPYLSRKSQMDDSSIFDFDRGTNAGLLFHDILECADFRNKSKWSTLIDSKLQQYGYPAEVWTPVLQPWLELLSTSQLQFPGTATPLSLETLDPDMLFRETEFSFSTQWGEPTWNKLVDLFHESSWLKEMQYQLPDVTTVRRELDAFLNGVVDCWCVHQGKIFLIDWKSNHLGNQKTDYSASAITQAMNDHHYHLQYLFYICAINRYLRLIRPDYQYHRDFAGVGYCFLRGIHCDILNAGWFTCLPPSDFIEQLEETLRWPLHDPKGGTSR